MPTVLSNVRFQGAGRYLLILSSSQFDPYQTWVTEQAHLKFLFWSQPLSARAEPASGTTPITMGNGVTLDRISTMLGARFSLD